MDVLGFIEHLNQETAVLLVLSIILFSGFIMTRLTNTLNMPKVSGYILAGILIGPCCLDFIPHDMIKSMGFISDIALAFIAFGVGKFFKKEVLLQTGKKILVITVSEALMAGVLVTFVLKLFFRLDWGFALILGAIATATAPASTMMTINQYKAKGEFVNTLLQIVALDDVVCLLAFSMVSAVINGLAAGNLSVNDILIPLFFNVVVIALGVFCGYFLSRLLIPTRSRDNRLILAIAMLLGLSGLCATVDISPLLSCMVFGAVYINLTRDKKLFRQINNFTPPVMSVFFIVSGMNLDLKALTSVGAIGVTYFLVRIVGKYLGTYLSCQAMGTSKAIRNYMGLALIPQAGVAIGLAFLGQRVLPPETGNLMLTIILSSSVLYEMVGPISAKASLFLSGSISRKSLEEGPGAEEGENGAAADGAAAGAEDEAADSSVAARAIGVEIAETSEKMMDQQADGSADGQADESLRGMAEAAETAEAAADESADDSMDESVEDSMAGHKEDSLKGHDSQEDRDGAEDRDGMENHDGTENHDGAEDHDSQEDHEEPEEYMAGLPALKEYNKGVDERDDYDIERMEKPVKNRKGKKKKKKKEDEKNK